MQPELNQIETSTESYINPWPSNEKTLDQSEHNFEDNFEITKKNNNDEINENGLSLPDSTKYLDYLEKKLKKLHVMKGKEIQTKKMLKELAEKRDGLFLNENLNVNIGDFFPEMEEEEGTNDETESSKTIINNLIPSTITNSALYESVERKIFPQLQTIDPEEAKKLIKNDILNIVSKMEQEKEDQEKKKI